MEQQKIQLQSQGIIEQTQVAKQAELEKLQVAHQFRLQEIEAETQAAAYLAKLNAQLRNEQNLVKGEIKKDNEAFKSTLPK